MDVSAETSEPTEGTAAEAAEGTTAEAAEGTIDEAAEGTAAADEEADEGTIAEAAEGTIDEADEGAAAADEGATAEAGEGTAAEAAEGTIAEPAEGVRLSRTKALRALIPAVGAAAIIGGVFLGWLATPSGAVTGWALYRDSVASGGSGFLIPEFVDKGQVSIFFTGLTILISGIVALALALTIVVLGLGGRLRRNPPASVVVSIMTLDFLLAGFGMVNLISWAADGRVQGVAALPGIYVIAAGCVVFVFGMVPALSASGPDEEQLLDAEG